MFVAGTSVLPTGGAALYALSTRTSAAAGECETECVILSTLLRTPTSAKPTSLTSGQSLTALPRGPRLGPHSLLVCYAARVADPRRPLVQARTEPQEDVRD